MNEKFAEKFDNWNYEMYFDFLLVNEYEMKRITTDMQKNIKKNPNVETEKEKFKNNKEKKTETKEKQKRNVRKWKHLRSYLSVFDPEIIRILSNVGIILNTVKLYGYKKSWWFFNSFALMAAILFSIIVSSNIWSVKWLNDIEWARKK